MVWKITGGFRVIAPFTSHGLPLNPTLSLYFSKGLTNRRAYKPPSDVEERIEQLTQEHCTKGENWRELKLTDPKLKYKVND